MRKILFCLLYAPIGFAIADMSLDKSDAERSAFECYVFQANKKNIDIDNSKLKGLSKELVTMLGREKSGLLYFPDDFKNCDSLNWNSFANIQLRTDKSN